MRLLLLPEALPSELELLLPEAELERDMVRASAELMRFGKEPPPDAAFVVFG